MIERNERLRLLYISYTPPIPTWGGAMAFYRHFVEQKDFEIKVVANCANFPLQSVSYKPLIFGPSRFISRMFRTRLMPWIYGPHSLTSFGRVPRSVWQIADEFKPDAVFTVAGSWDYSALVAQRVARRLKVPLVASFNDWFNYGWFPSHRIYHGMIERRFRLFYREADLAFCTCEGMRDELGPHPNAHVLYPIGAPRSEKTLLFQPFSGGTRRFVVAFGGSMADWYGPMLERLVSAAEANKAPIEFRFYGSNPSWSPKFSQHARSSNIFRGHLPFDKLQRAMSEADALILPMGFEDRAALVERTSFKTKFLDYLVYQKPIVVWGPQYCSAVRVAGEFDSAQVCTRSDANAALQTIVNLAANPSRQIELVNNARRMYEDRFRPDKIHAGLVKAIAGVIEKHKRTDEKFTRMDAANVANQVPRP